MAATARAASFGNPDQPPQGAVNVTDPSTLNIPGPHDAALAETMPSFLEPPATDVGSSPQFWASFNLAPRRIQDGGWGRQVTQTDFAISTEISGVNMRLSAGGIRELHWHQQAEWAIMTYGNCRITVLDAQGRPSVEDVKEGDLWYFPPGLPHSLQGLGPDGAEFVSGLRQRRIVRIQYAAGDRLAGPHAARYPGHELRRSGRSRSPTSPCRTAGSSRARCRDPWPRRRPRSRPRPARRSSRLSFSLVGVAPTNANRAVRCKSRTAPTSMSSKTIAAGLVSVPPGGIRTMHWHPNADEWQYYLKGTGRMTVFNAGPSAVTADFHPGDIGYVKKGLGHYVQNTGPTDLVFVALFRSDRYEEVSLADWLAHTPPELVAATFNLNPSVVARLPKDRPDFMPA